MLTVIIVLVIFSVLILIHEAGHLFAAKRAGICVEIFSLGMGQKLFGVKIGETEYRLSLFPFGGYCKMLGEDPNDAKGLPNEMFSKSVGSRFWVIVSGALTNYIFAFLLFWVIFMMGAPTVTNKVGDLLEGYPAKNAGIEKGDRIVSINGIKTVYWEDILSATKDESLKNNVLKIEVERNGNNKTFDITPSLSECKNIFGQSIKKPLLGVAPQNEILHVSYNPAQALYFAGQKLLGLTAMTYKMLGLILTGGVSAKNSLSGPIGIVYFIKEAAHMGFIPVLLVTAHLSMALAIFNLLPFPILDGGHIIFLLIEKIKGSPLSIRIQEILTNAAFVLLISFVLFVSWHDALKFTPLGKFLKLETKSTQRTTDGIAQK
ncbi:membrane-associated zinc metalloprotease [Candidatus Omnitrophus magneticus]|uniref:Zinc metalloprotease n=1 Tax=Candidatus Omnitrophus magneticus TaxID=1609969 RepID=A0A0F0CS84_9BACT|nr:membrane-associated zinc metalloprotease [Candidatus Omnitrophus magneticus]